MVFQNGAETLNPAYRMVDQVAEPLVKATGQKRKEAVHNASRALPRWGCPRTVTAAIPTS
jgi:ABC-type dipeptide/oligopeptide/nickel transport system ATPase component